MKLEIGFPIMENWIIIRSVLCSEGKQIDIFFVCCTVQSLMKSWLGFANYALTLMCKKILEHDFNTSVYTHSHLFDVFLWVYIVWKWHELNWRGDCMYMYLVWCKSEVKKVHFCDIRQHLSVLSQMSIIWKWLS